MKKYDMKIGDVFEVNLKGKSKGYFQFVAIDENQLRSDVIRVFRGKYPEPERPIFDHLVSDEGTTDFYAHCVIKAGIKLGYWKKVSHSHVIGGVGVRFRSTMDFGRDWIEVSERWEVWSVGGERIFVGRLTDEFRDTEYGAVFPPNEIVFRMEHGRYEQILPS